MCQHRIGHSYEPQSNNPMLSNNQQEQFANASLGARFAQQFHLMNHMEIQNLNPPQNKILI